METERLRLKTFKIEDLYEYMNILGQDEVGQWLPRGRGYYREEVEKFIDYIINHWKDRGYGIWAVVEKSSGKIIGHCGLNYVAQVGEVEVLYAFGKESWGKGYATEAAKAALDYGFNNKKFDRVIAFAKLGNAGSRSVIEKIGLNYMKDMDIFGMTCAYYSIDKEGYKK